MKESKLDKLYELSIITDGGTRYRMAGTFASLEKVYVEWRDCTFDGATKLTVTGIADYARRHASELTLERGIIRGMILEEL